MPVCSCCPNFISPGVERCENCATPVGELAECPTCLAEILAGSTQCRHCGYFISDDGSEGSEYPFPEREWSYTEDEFLEDEDALADEDF